MNPLAQIVLAFTCLGSALRGAFRPALWVPWLVLGAAQLAALASLVLFAHPWLSGGLAPLLVRLAGPPVLHYPNVFRVLPALYGNVDFVLGATLGLVVTGAAVLGFASVFAGHRPGAIRPLGSAGRRAGTLMAAHLPFQLLLLGLTLVLPGFFQARQSSGVILKLVGLVVTFGAIGLQAAFLFLVPLIMLGGCGIRSGLEALPRTFARAGWSALTLMLVASAATAPLQMLGGFSDRIVERGRPELVAVAVALEIGLALVVGCVLAGATTLLYRTLLDSDEDPWHR